MILCLEHWAPAPGYEGAYEVSNCGSVRSVERQDAYGRTDKARTIRPFIKAGYWAVDLWRLGNRRRFTVHRMVATCFVQRDRADRLHVNHKSGVKTNNRASNLEWVTPSENSQHMFKIGIRDNIGVNHPSAKLTEDEVVQIYLAVWSGERVTSAARRFGMSVNAVSDIKQGKKWAHITSRINHRKGETQ